MRLLVFLWENQEQVGQKMEFMNHRAYPLMTHLLQVELAFQRFHNIPKQCHQLLSLCLNTQAYPEHNNEVMV